MLYPRFNGNEHCSLDRHFLRTLTVIYDKLWQKIVYWCKKTARFHTLCKSVNPTLGPVVSQANAGRVCRLLVAKRLSTASWVITEIVSDASKRRLQCVIRGRVNLDTFIQSGGWHGYNGLGDMGYKNHLLVRRGADEFVSPTSHINNAEAF